MKTGGICDDDQRYCVGFFNRSDNCHLHSWRNYILEDDSMNETIEKLYKECSSYQSHGHAIEITRVIEMIDEAFKAGRRSLTDKYRKKYDPDFHDLQRKFWSDEDNAYLIKWYKRIPTRELSLALGRSFDSIHGQVRKLRKAGLMR